MEEKKTRTYFLDNDSLETTLNYDPEFDIWIEEYIDFETVPRYTPNGRRWRSVTTTDCIYSDPHYGDCGTCPFLHKEKPTDLIGVCFNECLRLQANATDEQDFIPLFGKEI